jgi:hypothetical protein
MILAGLKPWRNQRNRPRNQSVTRKAWDELFTKHRVDIFHLPLCKTSLRFFEGSVAQFFGSVKIDFAFRSGMTFPPEQRRSGINCILRTIQWKVKSIYIFSGNVTLLPVIPVLNYISIHQNTGFGKHYYNMDGSIEHCRRQRT